MKIICDDINKVFCSNRQVYLWDRDYHIVCVDCDAMLGNSNPIEEQFLKPSRKSEFNPIPSTDSSEEETRTPKKINKNDDTNINSKAYYVIPLESEGDFESDAESPRYKEDVL
jgi:hypothetical protein